MDNKERILEILESEDGFVSGSELADRLSVSRAAVWKCIDALRAAGYGIEAVTNRGYRLGGVSDVLTADGLRRALGGDAGFFTIEVLDECVSTITVLKERAAVLPEFYTLAAERQSGGRGRLGRSFYSPAGTGLYMSVLLRPRLRAEDAVLITSAAAVAVCRAIEELSPEKASIKWVNDVYIRGKKVCGILTDASFSMESGAVEYAVLGVGINVTEPESGFPEPLRDTAAAVFGSKQNGGRVRMAAAFLRHFRLIYSALPARSFVDEYRKRCFLVGADVDFLRAGTSEPARVLGVDERCGLVVRFSDGRTETLTSGEVSVRPKGVSRL